MEIVYPTINPITRPNSVKATIPFLLKIVHLREKLGGGDGIQFALLEPINRDVATCI